MKKVLLIKTSSMGDVVHALPTATDIKQHLPGVQLHWLVEESFADIPRAYRDVDEVICCAVRRWKKLSEPKGKALKEIRELRARLKKENYDLVIDLQGLIKSALLSKLTGSEVVGYNSKSIKEPLASLLYDKAYSVSKKLDAVSRCRQLAGLALAYQPKGEAYFRFRDLESKPKVRIAIFFANTSRETKLWPNENWIELGKILAQDGWKILFSWGSPAEEQRVKQIKEQIGNAAEVLPRMSIGDLLKRVRESELVVGLDTGMTHLSSAAAVPTVGIFRDYPIELVPLVGNGPKQALGGVGCCSTVQEVMQAINKVLQ